MDIGADALKENNAFLRGLFAVHILPWHRNVNQTLLLNSHKMNCDADMIHASHKLVMM